MRIFALGEYDVCDAYNIFSSAFYDGIMTP